MRPLFLVYRVLAYVVGVLLIAIVVGIVLKIIGAEGTSTQHVGDVLTQDVATAHGWLYIVYVVLAFFIATKARWPWMFTILMLAAGLIPLLIFWVERQVEARMHEDYPEVFVSGSSGG